MTPSSFVTDLDLQALATPHVAAAFALGSLSTVGVIALHTRYFKRIPNSDWVSYHQYMCKAMLFNLQM
jgi:hypothetical protein